MEYWETISKILIGEEDNLHNLPEDMTINDISYSKYAPVTSIDVERSFSVYKNIQGIFLP